MYSVRPYRGMGSTAILPTFLGAPYHCEYLQNWLVNPTCWGRSTDEWALGVRGTVAPPRSPTGDVLTVPPASGEEAQATVDALLNQQLEDQKALNAGNVQSGWIDEAASGVVDTGSAVGSIFSSPWLWGALGLGVFALVAVGGGSARRYGR